MHSFSPKLIKESVRTRNEQAEPRWLSTLPASRAHSPIRASPSPSPSLEEEDALVSISKIFLTFSTSKRIPCDRQQSTRKSRGTEPKHPSSPHPTQTSLAGTCPSRPLKKGSQKDLLGGELASGPAEEDAPVCGSRMSARET